jgi:hypothetical protein
LEEGISRRDWIKKLGLINGLRPAGIFMDGIIVFHGWDHCFSLDGIIVFHGMGSLFFMDERTVLKAFQGWIRRFPVFSKICFYT